MNYNKKNSTNYFSIINRKLRFSNPIVYGYRNMCRFIFFTDIKEEEAVVIVEEEVEEEEEEEEDCEE